MALERLPPRFLDRRVARALTSPAGVLLAGAGASAAILAGLPLAAAAGIGAVAWAARVAFAVPRRPAGDRVDPSSLRPPWRQFVEEALAARARYDRAVRATETGPLRDRLGDIGLRIGTGVQECWRVARRADTLEAALSDLDVDRARRELIDLQHERRSGADRESLERTAEALRAQVSSGERMARVAAEARDRLRLLDARLDEAVARAVELSLRTGGDADTSGLGDDVDSLVSEMEALRSALEDTTGIAPTSGV